MAGQKGRDLLIKISNGEDPETYTTIAGIRSSSIELNARAIDATSADSLDGWREYISGVSLKSARVRGRGIFKDTESDERMRNAFFSGELTNWQLVIPGLGVLTGAMHIAELLWGGDFDEAATFSVELHSAGPMSFEAEVWGPVSMVPGARWR